MFEPPRCPNSACPEDDHVTRVKVSGVTHHFDVLHELAMQEDSAGRVSEAEQILRHMVARHPDHKLSNAALHWLVRHHTSIERQWMSHRANRQEAEQTIQLASAELPVDEGDSGDLELLDVEQSVEEVDGGQTATEASPDAASDDFQPKLSAAVQLVREIKAKRPRLYGEPSVLFPLTSAARVAGQIKASRGIYRGQLSLPHESLWRSRAIREAGLLEAKAATTAVDWTSQRTNARPHLDGLLDDSCWAAAEAVTLACEQGLAPAQVAITHDEEYLYLAAVCPKRLGTTYLPTRRPRPRDANLRQMDRLRLCFDVNRDYASWWSFEIDHRGWTHESFAGDNGWNPKYYVASSMNDSTWTIEVAILLDELAPPEFRTGAWAVGVQRVVPEVSLECWRPHESIAESTNLSGILKLQ